MILGSHLETRFTGTRRSVLNSTAGEISPGANNHALRAAGENFPAMPSVTRKYDPVRHVRQRHVDISLEIDSENEQLQGVAILVMQAQTAEACQILLDAKELLISQVEWCELTPTWQPDELAMANWQPSPFLHQAEELSCSLPCKLARHQFVGVRIKYSVTKPNAGVYFVKTNAHDSFSYDCVWTQGQDVDSPFWFPCQDDPKLKVSARLTFRFPQTWECVSNGTLLNQQLNGTHKIQTWQILQPQAPYLLAFAMGELQKVSSVWRGKEISCYLPHKFLYLQQTCLSEMQQMLEFYSNYWGFEYPYEKYAQAFVGQFVFGGMENTTITINTDECLGPREFSDGSDFREVLVMHEMAHQWFGDTLTCESWSEGWLNEGFATHAESLWYEHKYGKDYGPFYVDANFRASYLSEAAVYQRPIVTNHYEFVSEIFDAHLYQKAALVLNYLRELMGEEAFCSAIGIYLQKYRFGPVKTNDLARVLEEHAGFAAQQFMDTWIYSAGHADLEVEYALSGENKCVLEVKISQNQKIQEKPCPIAFSLNVLICYADGLQQEVRLNLSKTAECLFVPLAKPLAFAVLDPRGTIVGSIKHKLPESFCEAILCGSHPCATPWLKHVASACIFKENYAPRLIEQVFTWLQTESCFLARSATYRKIAELSNELAARRLLQINEPHPLCRADWIGALGKLAFCDRPETEQNFEQELTEQLLCIAQDKEELLLCRTAGLDAILDMTKTRPRLRYGQTKQRLLSVASQLANERSFLGCLEGAALSLLAELEAARHLELFASHLLDWKKYGMRCVIAACQGLATISARHPELRHETRPLLGQLAYISQPVKLLWRVPGIFPMSLDLHLLSYVDKFLERKNYGPLSILIPRTRRARAKLLKSASLLDISEQWSKWEELKKSLEKIESQLERNKMQNIPIK